MRAHEGYPSPRWESLLRKWHEGGALAKNSPLRIVKYMDLHQERKKRPHRALLTQLRTGKIIGFIRFLSERRVPSVTWTCECGAGNMIVKHIPLVCPQWRMEKKELRSVARSTDLKQNLEKRPGATAAIRMILSTKLLDQFQATS